MYRKIAIVKDWGAYVGVKNGLINCYVDKEVKWSVSPVELSAIVIEVTASISSEVIKLCNEYGVDVIFEEKNKPVARLLNAKYGGFMRVWTAQFKTRKSNIASSIVKGKIYNQMVTLRYYYKKYEIKELNDAIRKINELLLLDPKNREEAMQIEAEAAKSYWKSVTALIPKELNFTTRKKRGAEDPFNVALNIGYGILRNSVWKAIIIVGLNPYIGYLHKFRSGRPSLVFDLMEEFRSPFIDRPLISEARENPEKIKDVKSVYSIIFSSIKEEEIFTQARKFVNAITEGSEYKPYRAK